MRAISVLRHGGPDVLTPAALPDPRPGPGEVLIAVEAAGVNFIDAHFRAGRYPVALPYVPGQEAVGRVLAAGPAVTGPRIGDRVGWVNLPGAYAELAVVPAERVVPIPEGVSPHTAAAVLLHGMTAHYLVHDSHAVRPGETILVHAAAGGMGLLLTQWIKLLGGRVIGTVSSAAKEERARAAGADEVIRYDTLDPAGVASAVSALTGGAGVAAVYDGIGAPTFDGSLAALRPRGTLVLYGQAGGPVPPFDLGRLNQGGSLRVTRPNLDHHIASREELTGRAADVLRLVASGALTPHIGSVRPLEDAARAHADLEGRRSIGKLLLTL
ncbi:quinone oxidoreductase family protein [Streptomyces sp. NPDC050743]|uniref:quinone oxidoreductase family protein n=1 Tax=Streptomyces sp. NPDC050743 TaxID=3365634 RepID=UPI0037A6B1C6